MNIYEYLDYRVYLQDFYSKSKKENAFFSYRYLGQKLGMDPGYLVRILQGKYHLANNKISKLNQLIGHSEKEAEYFIELVKFSKAKTEEETKLIFEKLLSLSSVKSVKISRNQYEFYHKWYYTAVRALIDCHDFEGDYEALGNALSPSINKEEAKKAVKLLKDLKLIQKNKEGKFELTDAHVTTGKDFNSLAVRHYQKETIKLASESLERHGRTEREINTITVSLDKEALQDIKALAAEFRDSVIKRIEKVNIPNRAFQMNFQLFPISEEVKKKAR